MSRNNITCPDCGAKLEKEKFCKNFKCSTCGTDLSDEKDILKAFNIDIEREKEFKALLKNTKYGNSSDKNTEEKKPVPENETSTQNLEKTSLEETTKPLEPEEASFGPTEAKTPILDLSSLLSNMSEDDEQDKKDFTQTNPKDEPKVENREETDSQNALTDETVFNHNSSNGENTFNEEDVFNILSDAKSVPQKDAFVPPVTQSKESETENSDTPLSAADAIRQKLNAKKREVTEEEIEFSTYTSKTEKKEPGMDKNYNSNSDGYYDDTKALLPPEPDVINKKTIYQVVGSVIGIIALTIFLILYI